MTAPTTCLTWESSHDTACTVSSKVVSPAQSITHSDVLQTAVRLSRPPVLAAPAVLVDGANQHRDDVGTRRTLTYARAHGRAASTLSGARGACSSRGAHAGEEDRQSDAYHHLYNLPLRVEDSVAATASHKHHHGSLACTGDGRGVDRGAVHGAHDPPPTTHSHPGQWPNTNSRGHGMSRPRWRQTKALVQGGRVVES